MITLSELTQTALEQYKKRVALVNGAANPSAAFDVRPEVHQKMVDKYQQQTDFLGKINFQTVSRATGSKLGLGANKTAASTTDTRIQPRRPISLFDIEAVDDYLCTKTDFDISLWYEEIDNWGYLPDFQKRLANLAIETVAQDKQRIGFNGTHRAKTSNRQLYPMCEDVNVGWLEKIRAYNPERHIKDIVIGADKEFKNIDALVEMAKHELIAQHYRQNKDLVVIIDDELITDKYLGLINQNHSPTENIAANTLYQRQVAGTLPIDTPAYFVPNALLITSYDNLSIYTQKGTLRRRFVDEPQWDRTTDYQSVNECYVVEDYDKTVLIENITIEG